MPSSTPPVARVVGAGEATAAGRLGGATAAGALGKEGAGRAGAWAGAAPPAPPAHPPANAANAASPVIETHLKTAETPIAPIVQRLSLVRKAQSHRTVAAALASTPAPCSQNAGNLCAFDVSQNPPYLPAMNLRPRLLVLGFAAALLGGCATSSSPLDRIDANRALYESWPLPVKEAILDQRVIPGMDADMVRMAVGEPTEINTRPDPRSRVMEEVWIYRTRGSGGGGALRNTSISVGGGSGGVYVGGSPISLGGGGGQAAIPEENVVIFQHGRVSRSTLGP